MTGFLLVIIESPVDKRCGLLNQPTAGGGDEAWKTEESEAETMPLPLVMAKSHVDRLQAWRCGRR